jgi:hypothetical protein
MKDVKKANLNLTFGPNSEIHLFGVIECIKLDGAVFRPEIFSGW